MSKESVYRLYMEHTVNEQKRKKRRLQVFVMLTLGILITILGDLI